MTTHTKYNLDVACCAAEPSEPLHNFKQIKYLKIRVTERKRLADVRETILHMHAIDK